MISQRTPLVPLFKLRDAVTRVKMQVDDTLDSSGAVIIPDDCPEAGYSIWVEEALSAVYKPLKSPPNIDIPIEDNELLLDDQELDPDTMLMIQERAKAKLDKNKERAVFSQGLIMKMYNSLSLLANVTRDIIRVYLKVFSVNDANEQRWVRFFPGYFFW